ncbi:hypothetical protein CRYUN_Cryun22dG0029000 [Craigia yunnanensis]
MKCYCMAYIAYCLSYSLELWFWEAEKRQQPESSQIYEKVKELLANIKPLEYAPDVAAMLHDVEGEQKDDYITARNWPLHMVSCKLP